MLGEAIPILTKLLDPQGWNLVDSEREVFDPLFSISFYRKCFISFNLSSGACKIILSLKG